MLLLSSSFQTIRITQGGDIDPTISGPSITAVKVLEPTPTKAVDLQPDITWITGPDDDLVPDVNKVQDLKPAIYRGKDLKPRPR